MTDLKATLHAIARNTYAVTALLIAVIAATVILMLRRLITPAELKLALGYLVGGSALAWFRGAPPTESQRQSDLEVVRELAQPDEVKAIVEAELPKRKAPQPPVLPGAMFALALSLLAALLLLPACSSARPIVRSVNEAAEIYCELAPDAQMAAQFEGKSVRDWCEVVDNLQPFINLLGQASKEAAAQAKAQAAAKHGAPVDDAGAGKETAP